MAIRNTTSAQKSAITKTVQRIAISNQLRGLASEYGITIAKSFKSLREQLPEILEDADNELLDVMRKLIYSLWQEVNGLTIDIKSISSELEALSNNNQDIRLYLPSQGLVQ